MRRLQSVWLAAAYALLILSSLKNVANPDVFWHLSAGRRILATGLIPRADWASFTRAGAPWVDFEWLQQALWALIYGAAGWWGLVALKTALFAAAALIVDGSLSRAKAGLGARACAVAVLAAGLGVVNDVRADNVSLPLFCATLALLERAREPGPRLRPMALAAAGLAGCALWANLHGGFVFGLAAAAVYAACETGPARRRCAALLLGGAAGALLTPYGPHLFRVFVAHARAEALMSRDIMEWQPAGLRMISLWPFWLCAAFSAWAFAALRPGRRDAAPWVALAGLFAAGALHQRNAPWFVAGAVLLPALAFARAGRLAAPRLAAPLAALGAAALLAFLPQDATRSGLRASKFPEGAARYLEAHPDVAAMRLYNPWGWGGYLGWRLKPPYRVFFDGRYIFHDLLGASRAATSDPRSWNAFLDAQKLDGALLERDQPDMRVRLTGFDGSVREAVFPYEVLFMPRERWRLLYEDQQSALYVRR